MTELYDFIYNELLLIYKTNNVTYIDFFFFKEKNNPSLFVM